MSSWIVCRNPIAISWLPYRIQARGVSRISLIRTVILFYHLTDWMLYKSPIISIPWETRRRKWLHFSVFGSRQSWVLLSYGYCWNYRFCAVFPAKAGIQYMINMIWHPGCRIRHPGRDPGPAWRKPLDPEVIQGRMSTASIDRRFPARTNLPCAQCDPFLKKEHVCNMKHEIITIWGNYESPKAIQSQISSSDLSPIPVVCLSLRNQKGQPVVRRNPWTGELFLSRIQRWHGLGIINICPWKEPGLFA